jgi:hypothetical protein
MVIARAVRGVLAMIGVRAAFGLESCQKLHSCRSEAAQHVFDDVIRPNPKSIAADLGRHMTVAEMPRESRELTRLRVSDVDNGLGRRSNDEPRPVIELHAVSIGHRDRSGQIEQYLVALIGDQADAPTMPMIEIEADRAGAKFLRPFTSAPMNDCPLRHSSHINTGSSAVPWAALTPVHR